jgi:UDP-glucose 4-epimerase
MIPQPEDPYGIAKYAMELDIKAAKHMWGLDFVIFRPHNVYGPNQNLFDKYRNVIGIFLNQILMGNPLTIFGNGHQTRAFSYIDDVAPIIAKSPLAKHARNQVFNVGADTPYSLNVLAQEVSSSMSAKPKIVYLDARKEVEHAVSDHSKVKCFFQAPAPVDLRSGLLKMVTWVKAQGKLFSPIEFEAVEVLKDMPTSWITKDLKEEAVIFHSGPKNNSDIRLRLII